MAFFFWGCFDDGLIVDGLGEGIFGESYLDLFLMDKLKSLLTERSERANSFGLFSLKSFTLAFFSETSSFTLERCFLFYDFKTFDPEVLLLSPTGTLEDF